MRYKVQTPSRYIIKGTEKKAISDNVFYQGSEIDGWRAKSHKIVLTCVETREKKVLFPGEIIQTHHPEEKSSVEPTLENLTKAEILALMPDKEFPKRVTKQELLEAYNG